MQRCVTQQSSRQMHRTWCEQWDRHLMPHLSCWKIHHRSSWGMYVFAYGKQKSKLKEYFHLRKQYPSHKRWHLFGLMYYWAFKLSVSINKSDYSTCNKLKNSEHLYNRCTKKDCNSNVVSHSLCIVSLKKPFSFHLFFSSESHNYSNNSTCYALAICKWKTEVLFIKTGKLKQTVFIMLFVQSEGKLHIYLPEHN